MASDTLNAAALLMACGRGDQSALRALYEKEGGRMLGVAQRLLKRRALAEEAVHDAFVLVWRHAARFDPARGEAMPWLYTILRNRALSILRDERRLQTSDTPIAETTASEDDDPETILSKLSDAKALRHCLEKLEAPRRHAVLLAFVNGLTHAELAVRLNLPLGTIKSWIRRSLVTLKECLG
jgi:RNA polymerase sigma factor (sigma-70 family)